MKFAHASVPFALATVAAGSTVTPVQKVIQLLDNMLAKGKEEKHAEQVQFASFSQFCSDTTTEKKRAIKEAEEALEILKADIGKYTSDADQLAKEIAGHDEDVAAWTGDVKAATKVREIEKGDYDALHKDYSESVDALTRAVAVLKKQAHNRAQAPEAALTQLTKLNLIPAEAKHAIDLFLMQDSEDSVDDQAPPEAHGYETQSHGVIDMLEKLQDKFTDERTQLEKSERNAKHAHNMLVQDLTAQKEQAESDREQKAVNKSKKLQSKAEAEGSLSDTSSTMEQDQKYLADLSGTCGQKASDFEQRQQLRAEELQAIEKAIEIMSSGAVAGNAAKHLPSLAQKASGLAQLRSRAVAEPQQRAADFLSNQARRLGSRVLSTLALKVAEDPFSKVKKMIKDMIVRLMEEANEEADHKGWCDTELSTNEQTRKEKTEAVETLHAEIDQLQASTSKLNEDITELSAAVAGLDADMAKMTEMRQTEKAENEQTIKDSSEAQTAVAQALSVLREFYAKAGEATALVQQARQMPGIFDSPYKGMQSENGGVIGMLEVIQSDFARLEADTSASESTAQKEYDEFMTQSKVDKESKSKDIEHKSAKRQDETQALTTKNSDLEGTQKELDAALAYYDKLKPSCVDSGVSYDDRVARRKEEIESLQEALRILNGEELA